VHFSSKIVKNKSFYNIFFKFTTQKSEKFQAEDTEKRKDHLALTVIKNRVSALQWGKMEEKIF
jgi:hypothetical protein